MKKYSNCQEIIEHFNSKHSNRIINTFDSNNAISSALSMKFYNDYIISYTQSINLLENNIEEITNELKSAIYLDENNSLYTENYYIDLSFLSVIKFKDITKIEKKLKYTTLTFTKGLRTYVYCYNHDIATIISNDELFTSSKKIEPYEIIKNKISSKN